MTRLILLAALALVSLLAGSSSRADEWPCFQHDPCHSGATSHDLTLPLAVRWEKEIGWSTSQAIAVGGKLFLGRWSGDVLCLDQKTGDVLWTHQTSGPVLFSACVDDGRVFIGSEDGGIYCLSTAGRLLWKFSTGEPIWSSPVAADGLVFCGSKDGKLYALRASDGRQAWAHDFGSPVWSSPAYHSGVVFCGSKHGAFAALDARTGRPRWTFQTYGWMANNSPSVADGRVFVPALHQQFLPETGEWHIWTQGAGKIQQVLAEQRRTACFFCLDEQTGARRWEYPTPEQVLRKTQEVDAFGNPVSPLFCAAGVTPTLAAGRIYLDATSYPFGDGSRQLVVLEAASGRLLAQSRTPETGLFASPAVASQVLVAPRFCLARTNAFDPVTGKHLGGALGRTPRLDTKGHTGYGIQFMGAPSCADGVLFVGGGIRHGEAAGNGYVRAFAPAPDRRQR